MIFTIVNQHCHCPNYKKYINVKVKYIFIGCCQLLNQPPHDIAPLFIFLFVFVFVFFLYLYLYLYLYCQLLNQPPVLPHVTLLPQVNISLLLFCKTRYIPKFSNGAEFFLAAFPAKYDRVYSLLFRLCRKTTTLYYNAIKDFVQARNTWSWDQRPATLLCEGNVFCPPLNVMWWNKM